MKKIIAGCFMAASVLGVSAVTPLWLRDVQISPDGSKIAFTYKGDIYTVAKNGGSATRLTTLPTYEANPVWSPDGKQIAFASNRNGNLDIFIMPAEGGTARRLTTFSGSEIPQAFTPDGKNVLFAAQIQDPTTSVQFPSGRLTELYQVPVNGGKTTLVNAATINVPAFLPDGKSMVYEDNKGMENVWRKHHTSSVAHDIWHFDGKTKKYTNLTANHAGEDRNPIVTSDGKTIYFLSERDGKSMNVYSMSIDNPDKVTEITRFKTHPVRFLSRANDGTMAFGYDGEIYVMGADNRPSKVKIDVVLDEQPEVENISLGVSSGSVSPDGKQLAFISRGNVFVTATDYSSTRQISDTPQAESQVSWSPDGKTLVYTSERDGHWNLYTAAIGENDPNFSNATTVIEKPLFNDKKERTYAAYSPDGKSLAFVQDRKKIMVMDLKSKKVRQLTDGSAVSRMSGGEPFTWSPDSKWLLTEVNDHKHDPYSDIAIINVETGAIHNLTQTGYTDSNPKWALDGNAIIFGTERYGLRAHASWGSQDDIMMIFLNRETFDRFKMNEEDYALYKEEQKKSKKENADKKDDKKDAKKDSKDVKDSKESKDIVVEFDGIDRRTIRLTPFSSMLADFIITKDGESLYFISTASSYDGSADLWKVNLRKNEPRMVSKNIGRAGMEMDNDGKIYLYGRQMKRLDPRSEKVTPISISGSQRIDHKAEREYMFDYVKVQERERFYTPDMHGVDWEAMTENYRKFLPHINNNYDFAEMLSELLGELNVSHTGGRYSPKSDNNADRTAELGLLYDMAYEGDGLKVDEIVAGGPFDIASTKLVPGAIIEKINGEKIDAQSDHSVMFNNIGGKKTLVSFVNPDGSRYDEVIKPISAGVFNKLMYNRWVARRAADVDRWSNGRLGYVHIPSMNDESFRPMYADVLGKYNNREGIVIDVRNNGGGRMHEDIEVMFSGKKYLTQVVRGQETCDMPSRRWNKPSIMVQCEACYSNAHGTPWVYKTMGLGKLVGMPVPGTMTSVNWVTMQDPSMVFGIPVVGYRTAQGNYLENTQLEPDVKVPANPGDVINGEDLQLKTAVETLLKDIDSKK